MTFEFEQNDDYIDFDLDALLQNKENRTPNKFGLYRTNCLVVGGTGCGKTTTILKALLSGLVDNFGVVIIICPRESIESGLYKKLYDTQPSWCMFYILGEDNLPSIQQLNDLSKEVKCKMAVIIDDFINAFTKLEWLVFKRYITQLSRVEHGASLFALVQDMYTLSPSYRKNMNMFLVFPASQTQLQFNSILRDYYANVTFTPDELKSLYTTLRQDKHGSLWLINNGDPEHSMMYNNVWIKKAY